MSANHPTPWWLDFDEVGPAFTDEPILDADGCAVVCTDSGVYPPDPDTCREIVAAVNDHKRLLDLLRRALEYLGEFNDMDDGVDDRLAALVEDIEAALRPAQRVAMIDGRRVVCLHGRVAVTPDGREHEIVEDTDPATRKDGET